MSATCPRCGRQHPEFDTMLCSDCRAALASEAAASGSSQTIQLAPILRDALAQVQPGEDLDEALLRALKSSHPADASMLLPAMSRLIADEAQRRGVSKDDAVRRLAEAEPGPQMTLRISGQQSPTFTSVTETRVITLGDRKYGSLEELPPDVRRAVEAGLARREKPQLRLGCSTALLSGLLGALLRRG